jgi:hypothetical protein
MQRRALTTSLLLRPSSHQLRSMSSTTRSRSRSAIRLTLPPADDAIKEPSLWAGPGPSTADGAGAWCYPSRSGMLAWRVPPASPGSSTAEHLPCNQAIGVQFSSRARYFDQVAGGCGRKFRRFLGGFRGVPGGFPGGSWRATWAIVRTPWVCPHAPHARSITRPTVTRPLCREALPARRP